MTSPIQIRIAPPTDHFSEIILLGVIAGGCIYLAGQAIHTDKAGEASAWTAVLMAIISAIKERWTQRSVDRMGQQLGNSLPGGEPPPQDAAQGARQTANAAERKADTIEAQAEGAKP